MSSTSTSSSAVCVGCGETFGDDWVKCGSCQNGGMTIVTVGKEVAASCVTAVKFDACALLSAQVSKSAHFANFF
jgi:hypothetical protein